MGGSYGYFFLAKAIAFSSVLDDMFISLDVSEDEV